MATKEPAQKQYRTASIREPQCATRNLMKNVSALQILCSFFLLTCSITTEPTLLLAQVAEDTQTEQVPTDNFDFYDTLDSISESPDLTQETNTEIETTKRLVHVPNKRTLKIASWHLDNAVNAGMIARQKPRKKTWRHTFGAERISRETPDTTLPGFDADIVMLQGVRSIRELRQMFPARTWRVVLSRQLLPSLDRRYTSRGPKSAPNPATAIAVRYQRGVRVTGVAHLTELMSRDATQVDDEKIGKNTSSHSGPPSAELTDKDGSTTPPENTDPSGPIRQRTTSAGTAVRLFAAGQVQWFVSVAFSDDCRDDTSACDEHRAFMQWLNEKVQQNKPVLVAGAFTASKISSRWNWFASALSDCGHQHLSRHLPQANDGLQYEYLDHCIVSATIK